MSQHPGGPYVTSADMEVWCEQTIEAAPLSSCKTAAEHLLLSNKNNAARVVALERKNAALLSAAQEAARCIRLLAPPHFWLGAPREVAEGVRRAEAALSSLAAVGVVL